MTLVFTTAAKLFNDIELNQREFWNRLLPGMIPLSKIEWIKNFVNLLCVTTVDKYQIGVK